MNHEQEAMDRHITGNYGEDSAANDDERTAMKKHELKKGMKLIVKRAYRSFAADSKITILNVRTYICGKIEITLKNETTDEVDEFEINTNYHPFLKSVKEIR